MRILFLAPHPFYQDRGTPIAVHLLLRTLSARGDTVDVVTYHEGDDRTYPGVTLHRIRHIPAIRNIRPGFSLKKLICDAFLALKAWQLVRRHHYDVVHAVEESVFIAMAINRLYHVPYLYDMDSSMPQQMVQKERRHLLAFPMMKRCESAAARGAKHVVAVCDSLAKRAKVSGADDVVILRDVSLLSVLDGDEEGALDLPPPDNSVTFMYIGNLEPYQGIDLMLEGFAGLSAQPCAARLVIVGGNNAHIAQYRQRAAALGIGNRVHFAGQRPIRMLPRLFEAADVLVSPRIQGRNTPMKIYSYLDSGRPILATRLTTHTQVLTDDTALLAAPKPEAFAEAMLELVQDPDLRQRLAANAKHACDREYSFDVFQQTVNRLYDRIAASIGSTTTAPAAETTKPPAR